MLIFIYLDRVGKNKIPDVQCTVLMTNICMIFAHAFSLLIGNALKDFVFVIVKLPLSGAYHLNSYKLRKPGGFLFKINSEDDNHSTFFIITVHTVIMTPALNLIQM